MIDINITYHNGDADKYGFYKEDLGSRGVESMFTFTKPRFQSVIIAYL